MELQYKGLRILNHYCSCQDLEFRSAMETSSVDIDKLLSKNFSLWIQCPKISLLLFKDGADLRMESFSCKHSPHTLLLGANGFTLLTTCRLILKLMFFFFNFQTWSLSFVDVGLCSNLKDDLCKLNLVLNSFSVSPIYISWLFKVVSVTVALYTTHLVRHLPSSGQELFCQQLHSLLSWVDSLILCSCSKRWLLLEIVCLTLGRQL